VSLLLRANINNALPQLGLLSSNLSSDLGPELIIIVLIIINTRQHDYMITSVGWPKLTPQSKFNSTHFEF